MTDRFTISPEAPSSEAAIYLTSNGFGQEVTDEFAAGVLKVLSGCSGYQTAVDEVDGKTAGFIGYTNYPLEVGKTLYINTVMINPSLQGKSLAGTLIESAVRAEEGVQYVSFKTQSARMYLAAKRLFHNIFPGLGESVIPDDVRAVGDEIARLRGGTFPVHRHSYGASAMYGQRPDATSHPEFYDLINFDEGDALFCVSRLTQAS